MDKLFVQYGCGASAPDGWVNFDASPTLRIQRWPLLGPILVSNRVRFPDGVRYGDIVSGLPLGDGCCRAVYCSHVLEHLSYEDCRLALKETHRILESGGTFRGVLPDLERHVHDYLATGTCDAALTFMSDTLLGQVRRPRGALALMHTAFGNTAHRWMWDFKSLESALQQAGFRSIRRAYFGDSQTSQFVAVENRSRWDGCLGFECTR